MKFNKKPPHLKIFAWFLGVLIISLWVFVAIQETILQKWEILFLESGPIDPRDLLRWDYVILSYAFENDERIQNYIQENNIRQGTRLYISFERDDANLWSLKYVSVNQPSEDIFLRVTANWRSWWWSQVDTHIGRYFVPEWTGREIERIRSDMTIKLRVNNNWIARIVDLYHKGEKIIPGEFRLN